MARKYFKLPRPQGAPGIAVLYGTDMEIAQGLAGLRAAGQEPIEVTASEARRIKDQQRREDARERSAALQKRSHGQLRLK